MRVHTIEMNYEYQMVQAMKQLLDREEKKIDDFECPDDLMSFLWDEKAEFGRIIVEHMGEWADEEDWFSQLEDAS